MPDGIATRLWLTPRISWSLLDLSDGEILPLLGAPWRQKDPDLGQTLELLIAPLVDRILLQVESLEAAQAGHHGLHVQLGHIVLPDQ